MPSDAEATFLFADIAGFTALTEAHGDEEAVQLVEEFASCVQAELPGVDGELSPPQAQTNAASPKANPKLRISPWPPVRRRASRSQVERVPLLAVRRYRARAFSST